MLLSFIIFLLFIISVSNTKLRDDDEISLVKNEYGHNTTTYKLNLFNKDAEIYDLTSARLAYISNKTKDEKIFNLFSSYFNRRWLFFVTDKKTADDLLIREDYEEKEISLHGIIVPKSLKYSLPDDNNNEDVPVFEVDDNFTQEMKDSDIRVTRKDLTFFFNIQRSVGSFPETYLLLNAILTIIIGITILIAWKIALRITRWTNVLSIHKFLNCIPFLVVFSGISFLIKAISVRGQDPYKDYDSTVYVDTALITLNAVFRTTLWFIILLLAYGWKISIQTLSANDIKYFMKMFLFIYVCMCIDQILDTFGNGIWVFHYSEIKNLLFYIFFLWLLNKRINFTEMFLKRKMYYAHTLAPQFVDGLVYKINLINKHRFMIFTYLPIYIIVLIIHKTFVYKYDTTIFVTFNYHLIDIYITIYLLWIFRPKELPQNFDFDFGNDMNENFGLIYKIKLPSFSEFWKKKGKQNEVDIKEMNENKEKKVPIIVFHPSFAKDNKDQEDSKNINKFMDCCEVGYPSLPDKK